MPTSPKKTMAPLGPKGIQRLVAPYSQLWGEGSPQGVVVWEAWAGLVCTKVPLYGEGDLNPDEWDTPSTTYTTHPNLSKFTWEVMSFKAGQRVTSVFEVCCIPPHLGNTLHKSFQVFCTSLPDGAFVPGVQVGKLRLLKVATPTVAGGLGGGQRCHCHFLWGMRPERGDEC